MPPENDPFLPDRRHVLGFGLAGFAASALPMPAAGAFAGASVAARLDDLLDATASGYGTVGYSAAVLRRG